MQEERESEEGYTLFHPAEVELQRTLDAVLQSVSELNPQRVVFDSLSEMRLAEARKLGFTRCLVPKQNRGRLEGDHGLELCSVGSLAEAIDAAL